MFSTRPDNLPSVLFQPSLTVLSLSVGLTIFHMRAVPQYSFYFFIDVLVKSNASALLFIRQTQRYNMSLQASIPSMGMNALRTQCFVSRQPPPSLIGRTYPISLTVIFGISIDLLKQLLRCVTSLLIFFFMFSF